MMSGEEVGLGGLEQDYEARACDEFGAMYKLRNERRRGSSFAAFGAEEVAERHLGPIDKTH